MNKKKIIIFLVIILIIIIAVILFIQRNKENIQINIEGLAEEISKSNALFHH